MLETISLTDLRGACLAQRKLFRQTFGDSCPVNAESLLRARVAGLRVEWVLYQVFTPDEWAEYERQRDSLFAEYLRQRASLFAKYERQHAPLFAEYLRQHDALLISLIDARPALSPSAEGATVGSVDGGEQ